MTTIGHKTNVYANSKIELGYITERLQADGDRQSGSAARTSVGDPWN